MKNQSFLIYTYVVTVLFGWGISVFFDKLAANSLGSKGTYLYLLSFMPSLVILLFFYFWGYKMVGYSQTGVLWLIISTICNLVALGAYFLLFTKTEASWASAMTAVYPVITIILAAIFFRESMTITRLAGIILAMLAVVFLSL